MAVIKGGDLVPVFPSGSTKMTLGYFIANKRKIEPKQSLSWLIPCVLIAYFTITERILTHWLVESYGLWEYRPWKWRNMWHSFGCFVFGFS